MILARPWSYNLVMNCERLLNGDFDQALKLKPRHDLTWLDLSRGSSIVYSSSFWSRECQSRRYILDVSELGVRERTCRPRDLLFWAASDKMQHTTCCMTNPAERIHNIHHYPRQPLNGTRMKAYQVLLANFAEL
jgi:hypothetical protein